MSVENVRKWLSDSKRALRSVTQCRERLQEAITESQALLADLEAAKQQMHSLKDQVGDQSAEVASIVETSAAMNDEVRNAVESAKAALSIAQSIGVSAEQAQADFDKIEAIAKKAAVRSAHIEDGFKYVDQMKPKVEVAVDTIEKLRSKAESIYDEASARGGRLTEIETAASEARDSAIEAAERVAVEADRLEVCAATAAATEGKLKELVSQYHELDAQVRSLLPGATSAGLASSFNARASEFDKSVRNWEIISVVSLVGLCVYALFFGDSLIARIDPNAPAVTAVLLLTKTMIALPLVWLALFAGRRGGILKRVREDYRYKADLATAFEGFKTQLSDIPPEEKSQRVGLSETVLGILSAQPGRLYDAKHQEVTPFSAIADAFSGASKNRRARMSMPGIEAEIEDTHER